MDGITKSANFSRVHSTIEARMAGIASSLFMERPVTLADESDLAAGRDARTITLARGEQGRIELAGSGGRLTYADPIAESSIAALVAMVLGGLQLWGPKGTRNHRTLGYIWVGLMAIVAFSGFFIHVL
mgnify:CR=1 FL=1